MSCNQGSTAVKHYIFYLEIFNVAVVFNGPYIRRKSDDISCFYTQAQQHNVASFITGFVLGTASLCVTVMSPLIGYIVSTSTIVRVDAVHLWHELAPLFCRFLTWE